MIKTRNVLIVILLNAAIVAAEITVGLYANSMSLIADALHNLGDILAIIVAYIAIVYGAKAATERMTFGYLRSEMMAGFVNSGFLFVTMMFVLYESFLKLLHPEAVNAPFVIVAATVAVVANGFSAYLLSQSGLEHSHGHERHEHEHHEHEHHEHEDLNIKAAYLHMLSDALISIGVIIGAVAIYFFGFFAIDPVISILFSLYILKANYATLRQTFFSLMDINEKDTTDIENAILSVDGVCSLHDLHLYSPSSKESYFSAHIIMYDNMSLEQVEAVIETLREKLRDSFNITHALFQPETAKYSQDGILCCHH